MAKAKNMVRMVGVTTTRDLARPEPASWEWSEHDFRAMNTDIHLSFAGQRGGTIERMVVESFRYYEQLLSRFRPDSELCRLNDCQKPHFVASEDFYAAMEAALWASQQTGGIYDPTILLYLEEAGYDRTFEAVANPRPLAAVRSAFHSWSMLNEASSDLTQGYDYRHIGLEPFTRLIHRPPGLRVDLGGMGKGWTVDRVADELCQEGHFLLNAGGDLYAYGRPDGNQGWQIHLAHPRVQDMGFASLWLDHHAVATSTVARRRWLKGGSVQHHLIDPRSGRPAATDVISVSVVGGRVFTAEIYAKVALILGLEKGLAFLEGLPDVEGAIFSCANELHLTSQMDRFLTRIDPAGYSLNSRAG